MTRPTTPISHGRGGAGNMKNDDQEYVDAGIHREATPEGIYSTGRGGHANINTTPSLPHTTHIDHDVVPEQSEVSPPKEGEMISTGRGAKEI